MSDDQGDGPKARKKRVSKPPSKYANGPHTKGKGKPPEEHQFKKGCKPGPGRPRGSRNRSDFEKLLDSKVIVGEDRLGRPIRITWGAVTNQQLMKRVAKGDFQAIRFVKEMEFRIAEQNRRYGEPSMTPEEMLAKAEEEAERQRLNKKFRDSCLAMLETLAALKKARVIEFRDDKPVITQAASTYISKMPYPDPDPAKGSDG